MTGFFGTCNQAPNHLQVQNTTCLLPQQKRLTADANQGAERCQPLPPVDQHVTPETEVYTIGRRLFSTGSAQAKADNAPSLQELKVVPGATSKGHVIPFFKQVPPHVENSGDSETPKMKVGEELKPNMSARETRNPKGKDTAQAEGKEKKMNSQPGAVRKDSETARVK